MNSKELLEKLSNTSSVSCCEENVAQIISEAFSQNTDSIEKDKLNNLIALKKGINNKKEIKIMIAAHADEIGLMVKDIDDEGFIRFTKIGGVDQRTLLGAEVTVHSKEDIYGIIGTKPQHLQSDDEKKNAPDMDDLILDIGYSKEKVKELVEIGDYISLKRDFRDLQGSVVTGKAMDDKAGIAAMYETSLELNKLKHEADVYYVSTVQEEVGVRGVTVSTYKINPDIGIVIDVGFGSTPELPKEDVSDLGKGPALTIGGNIHPKLREKLASIGKEYHIPFQFEVAPGSSGTDAWAMQISRAGVPCLVISLPLRYMHTTVETLDMKDVKATGKLLARFISAITSENLEEFLCY